jgi:single-strand DNA-binding protein
MNLVVLKGNLGNEPVSKDISGTLICEFSLATKGFKDKTDWHSVKAFGKTAEICSKFLEKGAPALIQGSISYRKWKDKQGQDRWSTEIIADRVELLGGGKAKDRGEQTSEDNIDVPF